MATPVHKIIKTYPPRGPMQQFRTESSAALHCFRCGRHKVSKLFTVYGGDWHKQLCNACYGRLLSIHEIKAGTQADDEKAELLATALMSLATEDERRSTSERFRVAESRSSLLSDIAMRFLSTSEFVAKHLDSSPNLDWSPAIIGLCKTFEIELVARFVDAVKSIVVGKSLDDDIRDKDIGRVAKYCAGKTDLSPELGTIAHFLNTAIHSKDRAQTSELIQGLRRALAQWPRSVWLVDSSGAVAAIKDLCARFRNRAAHTEELSRDDYSQCFNFVAGRDGILWMMVTATQAR